MSKIHPSAVIDKKAVIGEGVEIGPFCVIGPHVRIGAGTRLVSHVVIDGRTSIGERNLIYSGASIGSPGQVRNLKGDSCAVEIGDENVIREHVTINGASKADSKTILGNRNYLMISAHVGHDSVLGDDITIANSALLGGFVRVEDQAVIGGNAGIHQFTRVGKLSMTGGMARVIQDVPPFCLASGHPAQFYGVNAVGLKRAGYTSSRLKDIKAALKTLMASGLSVSTAKEKIKKEYPSNADVAHLLTFLENGKRGLIGASGSEEMDSE